MLTVDQFYLVAIRLSAGKLGLRCYALYVNDDQPITLSGRPIVFCRRKLARASLQRSDFAVHDDKPVPNDVYCVYDVAAMLDLLEKEILEELNDDNVVNCLNLILDFQKLLRRPLPAVQIESLRKLADFLTFSKQIRDFFVSSRWSQNEVSLAINLVLGAILTEVEILR